MIALHKAYQVLGLEPGTSFESIKRRYRRLVMVWHPDRMQNEDGRREAEEELKRINEAFDALRTHFDKHHHPGLTCDCQPVPQRASGAAHSGTGTQGNSAEEEQRRRDQERRGNEEDAWRQEEERRRRAEAAAAEESARKADHDRRAADAATKATQDAAKQRQLLEAEQLRWRIALAAGAAVVLMLLFAFVGVAARAAITELQKQWTNQSTPPISTPTPTPPLPVSSGAQPTVDDPDNPYIPLEYRFPGGNPASWRKFMQEEERKQKLRDEEQRNQDIYFTKLAIDRNQRIIDHCSTTIAQLEAKLADPYVSEFEKNKLLDYRDFQQRNLSEARHELSAEQDKLHTLESNSQASNPLQ